MKKLKITNLITESKQLNEVATKPQINKTVKGLVDPRVKNIQTLKNWQYHLFPNLIFFKSGGDNVAAAGIYIKDGKHKWDGVWYKGGKPLSGSGFITKAQYDKYIKQNKVVKPIKLTADIIKTQGNVLIKYLTELSDKESADLKVKSKVVPVGTDLKEIALYLKNNMKSVKKFYAIWSKSENTMGIELPFTFKPTIAKFERDGSVDLFVDFNKNELSFNRESPKHTGMVGWGNKPIGKFKDSKDLLSLIKNTFAEEKFKTIKDFNDGPGNEWHY